MINYDNPSNSESEWRCQEKKLEAQTLRTLAGWLLKGLAYYNSEARSLCTQLFCHFAATPDLRHRLPRNKFVLSNFCSAVQFNSIQFNLEGDCSVVPNWTHGMHYNLEAHTVQYQQNDQQRGSIVRQIHIRQEDTIRYNRKRGRGRMHASIQRWTFVFQKQYYRNISHHICHPFSSCSYTRRQTYNSITWKTSLVQFVDSCTLLSRASK
jgi:hypothetical protein